MQKPSVWNWWDEFLEHVQHPAHTQPLKEASLSGNLAIDAMAFPIRESIGGRWPLPVAVFELENSPRGDRVAYSLWKLLCVRAVHRVVFAYRQSWEQARQLVEHLTGDVISPIPPEERAAIAGETAVVTGSRGEGETFPYGFFKLWMLDMNLGKFSRK